MQPVKSLETLVLLQMAKHPLIYLDKLNADLAVKLCEVSNPDEILPYLAKDKRKLQICEKLRMALGLYLEVKEKKEDYDTLERASIVISSSPPANILIECHNQIAKVNHASLERLRMFNRLVDEIRDGYFE